MELSNYTTPNRNDTLFFLSLYDFDNVAMISKEFSTIMAIVFVLITVTGIFANLVLIITIATTRKLYSATHAFIVNLAIVDLLTASFVIPYDVNFMVKGYYTYNLVECGIMHTAFLMSLPLAILNLALLTIERFITITFPFKRDKILTKHVVFLVLLVTWVYTLVVSLFPLMYNLGSLTSEFGDCQYVFPWGFSYFYCVVNFLIPIITIVIVNFMIFRIANSHEKRITISYTDCHKQQRKKGRLLLFRKGAKRVFLLVTIFTLCWLPYIVLVIWNVSCNICHPRELTWIGNAVNYMSVALNPLLYGLSNKCIRKEALKKIEKLKRKSECSYTNDTCENHNSKQTILLKHPVALKKTDDGAVVTFHKRQQFLDVDLGITPLPSPRL